MVVAIAPLVVDLVSLPMPTVAAVTGHAAAAGLVLALAYDYIIMCGDYRVLYLPKMAMGLPFPPYFLTMMREKVRDSRVFKYLVMKSGKIGVREAAKGGVVDLVKGSAEETVEAVAGMAEEFLKKKWVGEVYASIRMGSFPEICRAVGLKEETDQERRRLTMAKL